MLTVRDEVAKNLLYYRKRSGITQKSLAEALGVKHNSVSAWENGTNSIDIDTLHKVCAVLDVSVGDMFGAFANAQADIILNAHEKNLLLAYRKHVAMQTAVDRILGIEAGASMEMAEEIAPNMNSWNDGLTEEQAVALLRKRYADAKRGTA